MKATITKPDGTKIECEGTSEEIARLVGTPATFTVCTCNTPLLRALCPIHPFAAPVTNPVPTCTCGSSGRIGPCPVHGISTEPYIPWPNTNYHGGMCACPQCVDSITCSTNHVCTNPACCQQPDFNFVNQGVAVNGLNGAAMPACETSTFVLTGEMSVSNILALGGKLDVAAAAPCAFRN